jgi:glucosamine--fructose-6-phosphate aminotransferase (isomerizing)
VDPQAQSHNGDLTREEIYSQPAAWRAALDILSSDKDTITNFLLHHEYEQIIFTGCGSTYYLSLAAAAVLRHLSGKNVIGLPASEMWFYPSSSYTTDGRKLLIAVSRSGATTETINACEAFKSRGNGDLFTLSCYDDQPLAKLGDLNLIFPSGQEKSVAQTRAFSTLYLATIAIAAMQSGIINILTHLRELPGACEHLLSKHSAQLKALGFDKSFDRFYFLGSGLRYGLASELSLKMKEMSLCHSEPFYFFEFRHGPKSMVTDSTLIVGLLSRENHTQEYEVIQEMQKLGAQRLTIGEGRADIGFQPKLDPIASLLLYLPTGQVLALNRAIANDLNPDMPKNLDAVVRLPSIRGIPNESKIR